MNSNPAQTGSAPRPRWMIVDDDNDLLLLLDAVLAKTNDVEIFCFNNGPDACAAFAQAPDSFEFVITDLEMPDMNGLELQRRLRSLSPELKILLMTGNRNYTEQMAATSGFCGLLRKPFLLASLADVLTSAGGRNNL